MSWFFRCLMLMHEPGRRVVVVISGVTWLVLPPLPPPYLSLHQGGIIREEGVKPLSLSSDEDKS